MTQRGGRAGRRRRVWTLTASVAAHVAALSLVLFAQPRPPAEPELAPVSVVLVPPPEPPHPPAPKAPAQAPAPARAPAVHVRKPRVPPPPAVRPLPAAPGPPVEAPAMLSDAQSAGAATAGSGQGEGGGCDMIAWLQARLRRDPLVRQALAEAHPPRPLLVWNGDWVRHGAQDGAGLAAVREAIMWEVGFAPSACRDAPVNGYVLISLNDAPGGTRLALGAGAWRWTDLLGRKRR